MTSKKEKIAVFALILAYIIALGTLSLTRHYNFQTQTYDMGIFEQSFWNTIHGHLMANSIEGLKNHFGMHMSPWLLLLVPGYAIFPSAYFLLLTQTIALALGAWPLFLLARKILNQFDRKWPLIISTAYLIFPSLHWVNSFDFHELPFLVPILISLFYFIETKQWWLTGLFSLLAASIKEDAVLIIVFIGLYLLIKPSEDGKNTGDNWFNKERKIGATITILGLIYFLFATKIIMPMFGGGLLHLNRYAQLGESPSQIFQNLFTHPNLFLETVFNLPKINYVFWFLLPVAFLPLLSGRIFITLIPGLMENLLSARNAQFTGLYHYDSLLIAGIFVTALYGLKNLLLYWPTKEKIIQKILLTAVIICFVFKSPISPINFPTELFQSNQHWASYRKIIKLIPGNVSVAAETHLVPHLANREYIYMLGEEPSMVDVVIIDGADLFGFADENSLQTYADNYMNTGEYNFKIIADRYFILSKKEVVLKD